MPEITAAVVTIQERQTKHQGWLTTSLCAASCCHHALHPDPFGSQPRLLPSFPPSLLPSSPVAIPAVPSFFPLSPPSSPPPSSPPRPLFFFTSPFLSVWLGVAPLYDSQVFNSLAPPLCPPTCAIRQQIRDYKRPSVLCPLPILLLGGRVCVAESACVAIELLGSWQRNPTHSIRAAPRLRCDLGAVVIFLKSQITNHKSQLLLPAVLEYSTPRSPRVGAHHNFVLPALWKHITTRSPPPCSEHFRSALCVRSNPAPLPSQGFTVSCHWRRPIS